MICPRCGTDTEEKKCPKCGSFINRNRMIEYAKENRDKISPLTLFIGPHSTQILNKPVNYAAGFFRPFYLVYRKHFLLGGIDFFLEWLIYLIGFSSTISLLLYRLGFFLFWTSFFNPIYIYLCRKKMEKLQEKNICVEEIYKKGGVSLDYVFYFIIFLHFLFLLWLSFKWL